MGCGPSRDHLPPALTSFCRPQASITLTTWTNDPTIQRLNDPRLYTSPQVLDEQRPAGSLPMKAQRRLVVASCGNAGLAAATIAAAAEWPIDVCIPDNADPSVVANLQSLGKTVNIVFCPRDVDEVQVGDVGMVSTAGAADPTVSCILLSSAVSPGAAPTRARAADHRSPRPLTTTDRWLSSRT